MCDSDYEWLSDDECEHLCLCGVTIWIDEKQCETCVIRGVANWTARSVEIAAAANIIKRAFTRYASNRK
jgi:hypothetical protein